MALDPQPLDGPLNAFLGLFGDFTPAWLTNPNAAQAAVVIMSLFQIGEGFIVALATRQEIPDELYELAAIEGSRPLNVFRRIALPVMARRCSCCCSGTRSSASRRASSPR